jgi:type II secretory pathway component PulC
VNQGIKVNGASTLGKKVENERLILEYQGHGEEGKNPMYPGENSEGGFGFHGYLGNQKCLF